MEYRYNSKVVYILLKKYITLDFVVSYYIITYRVKNRVLIKKSVNTKKDWFIQY